jgi:hypothetical protein
MRKVTQDVGDDPQERALHVPQVEGEERRWLVETFYRLEAARWGLHRQALRRRDRRDRAKHWRPYRQENLKERYTPDLDVEEALTTLTGTQAEELDALLSGVTEHLAGKGAHLLPRGMQA